jgi:hypothetical protein
VSECESVIRFANDAIFIFELLSKSFLKVIIISYFLRRLYSVIHPPRHPTHPTSTHHHHPHPHPLLQHPTALAPLAAAAPPPPPALRLTKEEARKIRRRRKLEKQQEITDKIRLGLMPVRFVFLFWLRFSSRFLLIFFCLLFFRFVFVPFWHLVSNRSRCQCFFVVSSCTVLFFHVFSSFFSSLSFPLSVFPCVTPFPFVHSPGPRGARQTRQYGHRAR